MASTRTLDERITEVQERIAQLENQKKQLVEKQKLAERNARTKRLIERGAIMENLIDGADALTNEQIKTVLMVALGTDAAIEAIIAAQEKPGAAVDEQSVIADEPARNVQPAEGTRNVQGAGG